MPVQYGISHIQDESSFESGRTSARQVIDELRGDRPALLLLFSTVGHDIPEVIAGIRSVISGVPVCGCSGNGILSHLGGDEAVYSVGLVGIRPEGIGLEPFVIDGVRANPHEVGEKIAEFVNSREVVSGPDGPSGSGKPGGNENRVLFLFPSGLGVNSGHVLSSLAGKLRTRIDCVGGSAGNDYLSPKTFQFLDSQVLEDGVAGFLAHGKFHHRIGVTHGNSTIGNYRLVTRAEGNRVYELDQRPVFQVLVEYFGKEILSDFSHMGNLIGLGVPVDKREYPNGIIVRSIHGVDEKSGSVLLGAEVPVGTKVWMTRRDKTKVLEGTRKLAQEVMSRLRDPSRALYLYFDCCGRGSYLFGRPGPDVDELRSALGGDKRFLGFFTFGELAPISDRNEFHNFTSVLIALE